MIELVGIKDAGNLERERVVFRVTEAGDVGNQLILSTTSYISPIEKKRRALADIYHAFWIPDSDVAEGDLVIVYTKVGEARKKENREGKVSHFFYWDRDAAIWNISEVALVTGRFSQRKSYFFNTLEEDDIEP